MYLVGSIFFTSSCKYVKWEFLGVFGYHLGKSQGIVREF